MQVLCVLTVSAVVAVLAEEGHSSQYIHKHDDHHTKVEFVDKHGHHDHDYYVSYLNSYRASGLSAKVAWIHRKI